MSTLSFILPALTVISLFFYIFSAERAWLPKKGTIEWIARSVAPKSITADIKHDFEWRDLVIFAAITAVYGGILIVSNFTVFTEIISQVVCTAVSVGMVYLIAHLLFKNRVTALTSAVFAASDLFLLKTFYADGTLPIIIMLCIFLIILGTNNPILLLPAGLCLGAAAFLEPVSIIFTALPLMSAVISCIKQKNGKPLLSYALFMLVIPCVVFCGLSYFIYGDIVLVHIANSFAPPVFFNFNYCAVAAVCFVISAIHIFKDKSYIALFISTSLVLAFLISFEGTNLLPLFAGFVISLPADIIIKRGSKFHKAWCIAFPIVMFLTVLFYTVLTAIEIFSRT